MVNENAQTEAALGSSRPVICSVILPEHMALMNDEPS